MTDNKNFDVIIIGGSYAGLSAAMALGRSLRNVLIIDSGKPCNSQTPHSHNFLTQDGKTPHEISNLAKTQLEKYETLTFYNGVATTGVKTENGFEITTSSQDKFTARKLIFATGIKDTMPDIKGFAACWGISIIHCPYCHGYEHRYQNTAIIANGQKAFHLASMVNNLSDRVTILTNGKADFNAEQLEKLHKHHIQIIESKISAIEHINGQLKHIIFSDGKKKSFAVAYGALPFTQHSDIPVSLGCALTEHGYISIDAFQKTTVPHIYVCGDNSNMMRSVANAVSSGSIAGAVANGELVNEQF
ncbi:MAG TPA: NAD(P)/FAD-dependent oxidoreductase [Flavobacterium sp.]|uniref:NAD(P)/FAD-dependent oxidoreductase n=1 Tax=unclassified Flavobacterium TaxID=196869 RepID=UPI0025B7CD79|nr:MULTISPECIES: NAD(P)/FAD-dependent oxidoreductase [unclassified Flavobacterium]HRE76297.1 NAD(P)/FAD-dependent oxidoreductase [Flavobacterium sp.]